MRTIKFRAWDKIKNIMYDWSSVRIVELRNINESNDNHEFEFMQFTGLLDKNGVEIYEGDILADHYNNGKVCNIHEVKWENHCTDSDGYLEMFGWLMPTTTYDNSGLEIIGNIYQNPELLK